MIETSIKKDFLNLFYHIINDFELENGNTLNVFSLKIRNNRFMYDELVQLLGNKLYHFALSRTTIKKLIENDQLNDLIKNAKDKLRNYDSNEGELGEIMLYCLLESFLNAPKILTKLELKTANNDYVKGADGVHLYKKGDQNYQLILGESKLYSDLKDGISEAFGSISELLKDSNYKIHYEMNLVNSELLKEAYDEVQYNILKNILLPTREDKEIDMDYAFAIFLGFDFSFTDNEMKMTNDECRKAIKKRVQATVLDVINSLNNQIKKENFIGYPFHIYIIPFSDLKNERKNIIQRITQ